MKENKSPIGIICGGGNVPLQMIEHLEKQKKDFFLVCLKGSADPKTISKKYPQIWIRLGAAGTAIKTLKKEGIKEIVFAGSVQRPDWTSLIPDAYTLKVILTKGLGSKSTDQLLKALMKHIESEGFKIIPTQNMLPDALLKKGIYGHTKMTKEAENDIEYGIQVAYCVGLCDAGQCAVVQQGVALALEGEDGTNETIKRSGLLKKKGSKPILVKLPKPNQEKKIDLPGIGLKTALTAAEAGIQGIVLLENGALISDKEEFLNVCKQNKIFIKVITQKDYDQITKKLSS
ncbi:MAG: UDP-2,3-diacylglucosamine diphosphatase LpxI [Rickettsiales bacterium]|jgi:DUF1009 family protein|nr:UDP-2,3-diacylglucosamine diphosphatase LpxI [Rickettsiales bacterium]